MGENWADYVRCNNCDTELFVDIGREDCPLCQKEGCLMWLDDDLQEVLIDEADLNKKINRSKYGNDLRR